MLLGEVTERRGKPGDLVGGLVTGTKRERAGGCGEGEGRGRAGEGGKFMWKTLQGPRDHVVRTTLLHFPGLDNKVHPL